jgi:hypothetical protein
MTELSPAALTVWEAFNEDVPGVFTDYHDCLATTLRAAANELGYRIIFDDGETEYRIDVTDLLAIADELEAQ